MDILLPFTILVISLVNFGLFITVVVRLGKAKGFLHGILGLICSLYAFIWGWMVAKEQNLQKVMIAWSVLLILGVLLGFISNSYMGQ